MSVRPAATGHGVTRASRLDQVLAAGMARMQIATVRTGMRPVNDRSSQEFRQHLANQRVRERFQGHDPGRTSASDSENEFSVYPDMEQRLRLEMAEMSPNQREEVLRSTANRLVRESGGSPPPFEVERLQADRRALYDMLTARQASPSTIRDAMSAWDESQNGRLLAEETQRELAVQDAESGLFEAQNDFDRALRDQRELEEMLPSADSIPGQSQGADDSLLGLLPFAQGPARNDPAGSGKGAGRPIRGKPAIRAVPLSPGSESDSEEDAQGLQGGRSRSRGRARADGQARRPDAPITPAQEAAINSWLVENMHKPLTKKELGEEYNRLLEMHGFVDKQHVINQVNARRRAMQPGSERAFEVGGKHANSLTDSQKAAARAFYETSGRNSGNSVQRNMAAEDVGLADSKGKNDFRRYIYALERQDKAAAASRQKKLTQPPPKRPPRNSHARNTAPRLAEHPEGMPVYTTPSPAPEPPARGLPEAEQYEFVDPNAPDYDPNMPVAQVQGQETVLPGGNPEMLTVIGRG